MSSYCLLVPHYNHERQFIEFLPRLVESGLPILVIDDGSEAASFKQVARCAEQFPQVHLFRHAQNRGKGAAVKTGFVHAAQLGYTHAIQIDADGQHRVEDLKPFIHVSKKLPHAMICGRPVFDDSAPKARVYGRKVTDFWVALETLSLEVKDSLCGYRIYPLREMERLLDRHFVGSRMDFDTDIIVKSSWQGIELCFMDTEVIYPEQSVSHFKYLRDNLLLIGLHTRLMLGMLWRSPWLIYRRVRQGLRK